MRCQEVTRELSAPGGLIPAPGIADHVASCPRCAAWAESVARFDALWQATRPLDPPEGAFERVWARAQCDAEAAGRRGAAVLPFRTGVAGGTGRWLVRLSAAAAALLVAWAGWTTWSGLSARDPAPPIVHATPVVLESFEASPEGTLIISIGARSVTSHNLPLLGVSEAESVPAEFEIHNFFESEG